MFWYTISLYIFIYSFFIKDGEISNDGKLLPIKCVHEMQKVGGREVMTSSKCGDRVTFCVKTINIAPMESAALFKCLGHINNLKLLDICYCIMEYPAFRDLANLLKKDNKIEDLRIESCRISDDDVKHIIDALGNENFKVTRLNVARTIYLWKRRNI